MPKTYQITSETINFSLVVPDNTPFAEVRKEVSEIGNQIAQQQYNVIQSGQWTKAITRVDENEEEVDGSTMLGRLVADWFRSQS